MKNKKLLLWLLILPVCLLLIAFGAAWASFHHYSAMLNYVALDSDDAVVLQAPPETTPPASEEEREELLQADQALEANLGTTVELPAGGESVTNILLIGVDNDNLGGMNALGNADGLIILSINRDTRQIVMNSLMRDMYVAIPGAFNTKITLSYHYGGTKTLVDTVEANFGVPIDYYVLVNYINVADIVDAVGGLDITLTASEIHYMREKIENVCYLTGRSAAENVLYENQAGLLHLNGVQVAAYLRVRMAGNNDYERTERARRVFSLLMDKARAMSLSELDAMADTLLPCITTDLTESALRSLLLNAPQILKYDVYSNRIPVDGSYYAAFFYGSVIVPDYEVNRAFLYRSIYEGNSN